MPVLLKLLVAFSLIPTLFCQECGKRVNIRPPTETFYSPQNEDGQYGDRLKCSWKVSVDKSLRISLWFTTFEFGKFFLDDNCYDYLEMWDGSNTRAPLIFKSCAESLEDFKTDFGQNAEFYSSGNTLFLKMTTDDRWPRGAGFSATFRSVPEPATTTEAVVTTSPDKESTLPQHTTVVTKSTTQVEEAETTPSSLFDLSTTVKSMPTIPAITIKSVPTDLSITIPVNSSTPSLSSSSDTPSLQPSPPPTSSSWIFTVVVPTVSLVLLLICVCVTGFFIYKRSSKGKHQSSPNNRSINGVGTNPVTVVKEQSNLYNTTHFYVNESFHASPQGTYPPPYHSKNLVDDNRSSQMNACILSSEGVIGDVAYESFDGEECNRDNTPNAEEVTNTAYESYDEAKIVDNGDYAQNVGEVENIAYESYDGEENVDNGVNTPNIGEVSNIAYQSYDDQGKLENGDILSEGETLNVMYESYDRKENPDYSDDSTNRQVLNVVYESYDGENDVTYDKSEDSMGYEAIDGSQSMDDEYSKIQ